MKKSPRRFLAFIIFIISTMLACNLSGGAAEKPAQPALGQATAPVGSSPGQTTSTETAPLPPATSQPELIDGLTPGWHIYSNANHINALALHENTLWAASLGGVVAWDLQSGNYTKYTTLDGMGYLGAYDVTVCDIPETRIVVATEKGLNFFDPLSGRWDSEQITPQDGNVGSNRIEKLYCDQANNRLLIGYAGLGVYNFVNGDWQQYTEGNGLAWNTVAGMLTIGADIFVGGYKGLTRIGGDGSLQIYNTDKGMPEQDIRAMSASSDGALWLGTAKGLVLYQGNNWAIFNKDNTPEFPSASISALAVASDGTLWLATPYEEIVAFDPISKAVKQVFKQPGQNYVTDLLVDPSGVVYYATSTNGLYKLDGDSWQSMLIESDQLLSNYVSSLVADQEGKLWVGTDKGAQQLDPMQSAQPWQSFKASPEGPPTNQFQAATADPQQGMWFVHDGRWISHYEGSAWQRFGSDQGIPGTTTDIAVSAEGIKYVATNEGLAIIGGASTTVLTEADGLPNKNVRTLLLDGDTLWIGTVDGLARLEGIQAEVVLGPDAPGLPDDNIGVLFKHPDGSFWLGTTAGLARYDGNQASTILVPEPLRTMFFGLSTQSISDIAMDAKGVIWIATYVGLYRGDGQNWERLSTLDGLPTNNLNALVVDDLGTLWVAGGYSNAGGGLARFVPGEVQTVQEPQESAPVVPTIAAEIPPAATQAVAKEPLYDQTTGLPMLNDASQIYSTENSLNYWSLSSLEVLRDFYLQQLPLKGWLLDIDENGDCYDKDRCMGWRGYDEPDNSTWFFLQGEHAYLTLNLIREGYRVNVVIGIDWEYK